MNTTGDGGQPADDAADTDEGSTESTVAGRLRSVWNDRTGRRLLVAFAVGLLLVVAGTATASWVTTDGGDVTVEETTVETESGIAEKVCMPMVQNQPASTTRLEGASPATAA